MSDTARERALFSARSAWQPSGGVPVPAFDRLLERTRAERPKAHASRSIPSFLRVPMYRRAAIGMTTVAMGVMGAFAIIAARDGQAPPIVAEPIPTFACFDDPSSLTTEASAYASDRAIASAEERFSSCLMASPGMSTTSNGGDVTCGASGPLQR